MRSLVKTTTVVAAVGVLLLSGLPSEAQETTPNPLSPELKPLQRFIGSWEQQVVSKPAEWTPDKTTMTCPVTVNWILRGRMIEHRCVWSPGKRHGLCLMAYDAENKEYRQFYFDSNGGIPRGENRGKWDEATKTFTWTGRLANGIMTTQAHQFIDNDRQEWTLVFKDSTGKVCLDMEAKAKRKPLLTSVDTQRQGGIAPPPEMKFLQQMVGTWRESHISRAAEWTPDESRMTSILKVSPILGGHFVRCEVSGDDGKVLAMMIRTFDAEQQAYREWMFPPSRFGGESRGQWDEAANMLTLTGERPGITGVTTIRFSDKNTMQWSVNLRDRQGKVYYDALGKSVRQR